MSTIPPEGDEYNARRTEDLHAAIANKAHLSRRFYEMVRAGAPEKDIDTAIDAMAFIEREIPHIGKDLAVSVQGKNLDYFVKMFQEIAAEVRAALKEQADDNTIILAGVQNNLTLLNLTVEEVLAVTRAGMERIEQLEARVNHIDARHTALDAWHAAFDVRLVNVERLRVEIERIAAVLDDIPTRRDQKQIADELRRSVRDESADGT